MDRTNSTFQHTFVCIIVSVVLFIMTDKNYHYVRRCNTKMQQSVLRLFF